MEFTFLNLLAVKSFLANFKATEEANVYHSQRKRGTRSCESRNKVRRKRVLKNDKTVSVALPRNLFREQSDQTY